MSIAKYIDHTILKPNTTLEDINRVCEEAKEYLFAAVCVPPYFVSAAKKNLKETQVQVATVIGFPFGYNHYAAKVIEAQEAINAGAVELDMVMNIAGFKNEDEDYLKEEVEAIVAVAQKNNALLKVIIESGLLSPEEIIKCCGFYKNFQIDFLKTSTGYAEKSASIEAVELMRHHLPENLGIKASGGIKTFDFAAALLKAGATRLGCSSSVAIMKGEQTSDSGY